MRFGTGIGKLLYRWRKRRAHRRAARAALRPPVSRAGRAHRLPGELIVSLTSFPRRFDTLEPTLRSLLSQSVRPDRICLCLDEAAVPQLPDSVRALEGYRCLQILTARDIGPATKLIPTLRRFPDAYIVTADDDVYYPPNWLASIVKGFDVCDPAIVCSRAHLARAHASGRLLPYSRWDQQTRVTWPDAPGTFLFPTGIGGVLYPPGALDPRVFDEEALLRLTPRADDVWFFWMARLAGTRQVRIPGKPLIINWPGSQAIALKSGNVEAGGNDKQIRAMEAEFGLLPLS